MIHPATEIRAIPQLGYGVFATSFIPRGTVTWAPDAFDQVFTPSRAQLLSEPERQALKNQSMQRQDGSFLLCWDTRRFLNHSCAPNTLPTGFGCEVAIGDIYPGDQLTCDYAALSLKRPFSCNCQHAECRSIVHPEDAMLCATHWQHSVQEALACSNSVAQPLWHLVKSWPFAEELLTA